MLRPNVSVSHFSSPFSLPLSSIFFFSPTLLLTLQKVKQTRHQFAVLVDELQSGGSTSDYQATVMTAIKCIVGTPRDVRMRVKLRNQFLGEYIESETVIFV